MEQKQKSLQTQGLVMVAGLVAQYILGMITALFVQFPESASVVQNWEFARLQWVLMVHIALGLGLIVGAISLLVCASIQKNKPWKRAGAIGLACILIAFLAGERFVSTQVDAYSLVMSLGFIGAFVAYGWGLYASRQSV